MQIALLCGYPLCMHLAVTLELPLFRALAIGLLSAGILYRGLRNRHPGSWLCFGAIVGITIIIANIEYSKYLFYIPPVLVPALIAGIFISTLLPGKEPLVTAIGEQARGPLSPEMRRYTKSVTRMWAWFLSIMTVWSALLPWLAEPWLWSLVTNFLNYILVAIVFVGEFMVRRKRFTEHNHPSFKEYLKIVTKSKIRKTQA